MGNNIVRSLVLVLAVAGFSASSFASASASRAARNHEAKMVVPSAGVVGSPTPLCMPGRGVCGMD